MKFDSYKNSAQKIKEAITTYQGERKKLLDSEMFAAEFKQKKIAELKVKTFEQIASTLDAMREDSKKDYTAAYKGTTPANLEEARYWATIVHQDLSSMNPDQILTAYKAILKEGLPIKKAEFERVARNVLSSREEYHGKLCEFEVTRKANMSPEEKEQAMAIMAAESLEGAIDRIQDFASYNVKLLEEGENIADTGRLDYLDSPFTQMEKEIEKEFNPSEYSFGERLAKTIEANQKIVSESAAGTKSFSVSVEG